MKTTTITREYDDEGRCIREMRVEHEWPDPPQPRPYIVDDGWWWKPQQPWWQNPVITYTTSPNTSQILMH